MVNVISDDNRNDLYEIASEFVNNEIKNSCQDKIIASRENLSKLRINRDILKVPIMTISYNITLQGLSDKLNEKLIINKTYCPQTKTVFYHVDPKYVINNVPLLLNGTEFGVLTGLIYTSLFNYLRI